MCSGLFEHTKKLHKHKSKPLWNLPFTSWFCQSLLESISYRKRYQELLETFNWIKRGEIFYLNYKAINLLLCIYLLVNILTLLILVRNERTLSGGRQCTEKRRILRKKNIYAVNYAIIVRAMNFIYLEENLDYKL